MNKTLIRVLLLFTLAGSGFAGGIDISVSRVENSQDDSEFVPSRYFSFGAASRFDLHERVVLFVKGEYGSGDVEIAEPELPPEAVFDTHGRIWSLETGVDYTPFSRFFFLRASAGVGYLLHDYCVQGEEWDTIHTESETEVLFTAGAGTRFPVDGIPVLDSMHFLVSVEKLGDSSLISGEIGIGL